MSEQNAPVIIGIVAGTIILLMLASFMVTFLLFFQKKQQRNRTEKQQLQSQFSQAILQSQLEIKEQTLQHIACELHDNLGQIASLIKINLNTLQLEDSVKANQKIEDTKELVRQLITDLKSISVSLNSDRVAQLGIVKGIENEVERLNKTGQFEAILKQAGSTPSLDANTIIILYRMIQEIINNMVKHSNAKRISFSMRVTENLFTLVCSDDGVGFNVKDKILSGGSGLLNLQNRAKLINAQLTIQSSPEKGTTISIELPI